MIHRREQSMENKFYIFNRCIFYCDCFFMMIWQKISWAFLSIFLSTLAYSQGDMFISGNTGPVADAGRDIRTLSKGSIFLDGSRSFVTDGSTIKYHWEFSPGLVLNADNDFSSEISSESFGERYLKSVITYNDVLDVKLADNAPGTKLEVVLKIKDRLGFQDMDTLIVEYFDPTIPEEVSIDTPIVITDSLLITVSDTDSVMINNTGIGILIQSYAKEEIPKIDIGIINSIILNQIQNIGFDTKIYLNKNLNKSSIDNSYNYECIDDECASINANLINAKYVIAWEFAQAEDILYIRVFDSFNYINPFIKSQYNARYTVTDPWNSELIWGNSSPVDSWWRIQAGSLMKNPSASSGEAAWQWVAPTMRMAELYYTKNGLPIEDDLSFDYTNRYDVTNVAFIQRYVAQYGQTTAKLNLDREPRFYASLAFDRGLSRSWGEFWNLKMRKGEAHGRNANTSDYLTTGYGLKKIVHPDSEGDTYSKIIRYPFPIIRLSELYLNLAEALNEVNGPSQEIYDALNVIRDRAGIPNVQDSWGDATLTFSS